MLGQSSSEKPPRVEILVLLQDRIHQICTQARGLSCEKLRKKVRTAWNVFDYQEYQEELLRLKKQEMEAKLKRKELSELKKKKD